MGSTLPKQLLELDGTTILERTVAALDAHPGLDRVLVMIARGHESTAEEIASRYPKVTDVREGGATRNESTVRALELLPDDDTRILFHDAVRPLVSVAILTRCLEALEEAQAVDVAIPCADTIIEVDDRSTIRSIPRRDALRRGQTPQGFHAGVLRRAYAAAAQDAAFTATDDCGVVLRYCPDVPVVVVDGEERNLKITEPLDLLVAEQLLRLDDDALRRRVRR